MPVSLLTRKVLTVTAAAGALALAACGPDFQAVSNRLRQQTIDQQQQIDTLKAELKNRDATLAQLSKQARGDTPALQTLPDDRLAQLFTVSQLQIRSQTDSWQFESGKGLAGFRVFLRTLGSDGQVLPASGNLTIEAFELGAPPAEPRRLGTWTFTPEQMKQSWYAGMGLNQFAFSCPWQSPPGNPNVTFRATFTDALTGRTLVADLQKKVTLPAAPATRPK